MPAAANKQQNTIRVRAFIKQSSASELALAGAAPQELLRSKNTCSPT
jgi:hypothetical protein